MTAPRYALINALAIDRLPRTELDELLAEVQAHPPFRGYWFAPPGTILLTKSAKARALRHAQEAWLDAHDQTAAEMRMQADQATRPAPTAAADAGKAKPARPAPTRTQGGPQSITQQSSSAQALAIFAAIPACPVWGADPCTCALCTPQKATSP